MVASLMRVPLEKALWHGIHTIALEQTHFVGELAFSMLGHVERKVKYIWLKLLIMAK